MVETRSEVQRLAVAAERVRVATVRRDARRVVVRTVTETVPHVLREDLRHHDVEVTRVPVGRDVDDAPAVRVENGVTIIPVIEERLVVRRQLVLREELHVRTVERITPTEIPVTLREQRVVVEKSDPETGALLSQETLQKEALHDQ